MVEHVDAVELRVVVAAVLAVAADAVHAHDLARRNDLEAGSTQQRKGGEAEQRKKLRVVVLHGNRKSRWHAREIIPNRKMK